MITFFTYVQSCRRSKLVCWSLTSLCHSNGHIETMPAREINPFTALTRIRSQFLRTQWSTSNHQRVDTTTPQTAQPSGLAGEASVINEICTYLELYMCYWWKTHLSTPLQSCNALRSKGYVQCNYRFVYTWQPRRPYFLHSFLFILEVTAL